MHEDFINSPRSKEFVYYIPLPDHENVERVLGNLTLIPAIGINPKFTSIDVCLVYNLPEAKRRLLPVIFDCKDLAEAVEWMERLKFIVEECTKDV